MLESSQTPPRAGVLSDYHQILEIGYVIACLAVGGGCGVLTGDSRGGSDGGPWRNDFFFGIYNLIMLYLKAKVPY